MPEPTPIDDSHAPRRSLLISLLRPRVAIPAILLVVLIGGPFVFRESRVLGLPDMGHPFDVDAFGTVAIPPGENAFDDYDSADGLLIQPSNEVNDELGDVMEVGWVAASADVRDWLEVNRPTLAHWKQATAKSRFLQVQPAEATLETQLPLTTNLRTLVRLGKLEALRLESEGKLDEAWEMHRAAFRCSRHSGMKGLLLERLVGISTHEPAARGIMSWSRHSELTAAQLETALRNIEDDDRMTAPLSECLKVEYFVMSDAVGRTDILDFLDAGSHSKPWETLLQRAMMWGANEPKISRRVLRQCYANLLEHIDQPRNERPPSVPSSTTILFQEADPKLLGPERLPADQVAKFLDRTIIARSCLPGLEHLDKAVTTERARQRALVVAVALQLYQRKEGAFPASLETLIDKRILTAIPTDPFSRTSEPIRYRLDSDRFVVWSIGDNELDDGGQVDLSIDVGFVVPLGSPPAVAELPPTRSETAP